jgi:hypothetical protein
LITATFAQVGPFHADLVDQAAGPARAGRASARA